ncbi:MAG: EamA family transporter RarD [Oleispira antarctica]|nr:EamA family transporter RarD [Oleispira antarctica]MBQ0793275.1 EamA family transporter RarD [Oleispira antarctica]
MQHQEEKKGVFFALSAFIMWGIAPIYFKQLIHIDALEILTQRIIWAVVFLIIISLFSSQLHKTIAVLKQPKQLALLAVSACLLGFNWGLFIWSVNNNHMLEASLGYYINPLINVLMGYLFLSERLRKRQGLAVALALTGVSIQIISFGSVPSIALSLAVSFAFYGLLHKKTHIESIPGLLIESLILLPIAILYWIYMEPSETSSMFNNTASTNLMLLSAGIVTTLPLLCFTAAAKRLQYTTLGFIQYIGPSLMFILAVQFYGETLGLKEYITFGCIWLALLVFSWDSLRHQLKNKIA